MNKIKLALGVGPDVSDIALVETAYADLEGDLEMPPNCTIIKKVQILYAYMSANEML